MPAPMTNQPLSYVAGSAGWRSLFVLFGLLYVAGGVQHPPGSMAEMLANPIWVRGHATTLCGLMLLTAGLVLFRRARPGPSVNRWLLPVIATAALETLEMAVHMMAYVDAEAMAAGHSTPVLTTHLWLATLVYPCFAFALVGLIWAGQRERSLGSPWIGWIGMVGAVAHGVVMVMVMVHPLKIGPTGLLFPVAVLSLALWFILAGVWPVGRRSPAATSGRDTVGALLR